MALPVFFHDGPMDNFVVLSEETSKHVVQVLRMTTNDELQLTDGKGHLATAAIADAHKKKCTARIKEVSFYPKPERQVSIGISLLKNTSRFEWFLEKAIELGVAEIIPLLCQRTEKQKVRFERLQHIVIAAMIQSRQYWLPVFHQPAPVTKVIAESDHATKLIAHCEEGQKLRLNECNKANSVQLLIGPEGDFTPGEIELALQHHYQPVTLGQTRLRTETAGVAGAALLCIG